MFIFLLLFLIAIDEVTVAITLIAAHFLLLFVNRPHLRMVQISYDRSMDSWN